MGELRIIIRRTRHNVTLDSLREQLQGVHWMAYKARWDAPATRPKLAYLYRGRGRHGGGASCRPAPHPHAFRMNKLI